MDEATADRIRIERNQILRDTVRDIAFRILYVSDDGTGYWIDLDSSSNIPKPFSVSEAREKLQIGIFEEMVETAAANFARNLSPNEIKHRDKNWNLIKNIAAKEPDIYNPSKRNELLKAVEVASGVSRNAIYRHLGRYWKGGFRVDALAPNYASCGKGNAPEGEARHGGRPKRNGENGKRALSQQDYQNFQHAIDKYYRKGESLKESYRQMISHLYIQKTAGADDGPETMEADEKPSFGQFYYWFEKNQDSVTDVFRREGERKFNLRRRAILGRTETFLIGPGDSYQLDATIGDFYLVMRNDRTRLVGRPIIVLFKDAWSRMVTGMFITLESSSFRVWKGALINLVTPKSEFCQQFGLDISDDEWPCCGLPLSITTDNGEFAVKAVDEIVRCLGVTVENCPPYRGDLKGIIERVFRTLQWALHPYIPGRVEPDVGKRGAEDYRRKACVDIYVFTQIFILILLYYNNHHYMEDYPRTEDMRRNCIPAIPLHLWNYGVRHRVGPGRTVSEDEYLEVLMEKEEASVTEKGIRLNSLYYTCSLAEEERWFERARIEGSWKISVLSNPFSCRHIYIKTDDGGQITCSLVQASAQYAGYDKEAMDAAHEEDLNRKAMYAQDEDQAFTKLAHAITSLVEGCKDDGASGRAIIESLNKNSVIVNKAEEIKEATGEAQARREQEAGGLGKQASQANPEGSQEKPRSYEAVSKQIDELMDALLGGGSKKAPSQADEPDA